MRLRAPNLPLLIMVIAWGFNFVSIKILYREMTAPALALVRWCIMIALLVLICRIRKEKLVYEPGDMWPILLNGFIALGVYMVFFLKGLESTTPAEGAIMLATVPIFTYVFACLVGQDRFSLGALSGVFAAFIGVSIVILGGAANGHGSLLGNLTELASAMIWAGSTVYSRRFLATYTPIRLLTLSLPGAFPVLLVYGFSASIHTDFGSLSTLAWLNFAQICVVSGSLAFICFYTGVQQIGPSRATTYQFFVPVATALFAYMVFGKSLVPVQWLGMVVLIAGVAFARWVSTLQRVGVQAPEGNLLELSTEESS